MTTIHNENNGSHLILSGLNYHVLTSKNKYNVLIVFILYCKTLLLILRWDTGKVRDRFGSMGRFKGGLRCKGWVKSVIINVSTEINYRYNYINVFFFKYKYNVNTCLYTISALYQIINFNVSS